MSLWRVAGVSLVLGIAAGPVLGFSLLPDPETGTVQGDLEIAARWSPEPDPFGYGSGFHDGLQIAVAQDFAEQLNLTEPADVALLRQVIRQAFEAWETPDLRVDVDLFIRGGLAVLEAIRRQKYDVWRRRPTVSKLAKLRLFAAAYFQHRRITGK